MNYALYRTIDLVVRVLDLLILLRVLFSWINLGPGNDLVRVVYQITEPILAPLRRYIPSFGGLDITPMVALMLIELVKRLLIGMLF
jgi:YggT family protein